MATDPRARQYRYYHSEKGKAARAARLEKARQQRLEAPAAPAREKPVTTSFPEDLLKSEHQRAAPLVHVLYHLALEPGLTADQLAKTYTHPVAHDYVRLRSLGEPSQISLFLIQEAIDRLLREEKIRFVSGDGYRLHDWTPSVLVRAGAVAKITRMLSGRPLPLRQSTVSSYLQYDSFDDALSYAKPGTIRYSMLQLLQQRLKDSGNRVTIAADDDNLLALGHSDPMREIRRMREGDKFAIKGLHAERTRMIGKLGVPILAYEVWYDGK